MRTPGKKLCMSKKTGRIINAIDVGTSKVVAVIADVDEQFEIDILGMGESECEGMKKGLVTDLDAVNRSVYRAVNAAEKMADRVVEKAFVSVSGGHLTSNLGHGVTNVHNPNCITEDDKRRAIEATKYLQLPPDKEVIDIFEQSYSVDGNEGVRDPVSMSGSRLDVHVQILTGASAPIHNLVKSICRLDVTVQGLIPAPLAAGMAVLNDDEKDIGVAVLDMGAGTTDMALFRNGCLVRACVIPVGGEHVDNDIAVGLSTSLAEARRIKFKYGNALSEVEEEASPVELKLVGREDVSQVPQGLLCEIIHPRVRELFEIVGKEIEESGPVIAVPGGVVITGGASQLKAVDKVAEKVLQTHIRRGAPRGVRSNYEKVSAPPYATAVGIIRCAAMKTVPGAESQPRSKTDFLKPVSRFFRGLFK